MKEEQPAFGKVHLRASGKADSFAAKISGSGNLKAFQMPARQVSMKITGPGECEVNASKTLNVIITGVGDV